MTAATALRAPDRTTSQTVRAQIALRDLILEGGLAAGERVSELQMVERLGVSRTPVRAALVRLEEEGLLEAIASGGFAVRRFTERAVYEAIEIRGTLEGLAARFAAERGASPAVLSAMRRCVAAIDPLVAGATMGPEAMSGYAEANARFHGLLIEAGASPALGREIERAMALPFASPNAFVQVHAHSPDAQLSLVVAQDQHRCVVAAIEARESGRAEAIMREHARVAHRNLERAFANQRILALVPGSALIARRAR